MIVPKHAFILLAPALLLAGCNKAPETPATSTLDQPNESTVEQEMETARDALDDDIANDAAQDAKADAPANGASSAADTEDDAQHRYSCKDGSTILALYGDDDGTARLTVAGRNYALLQADAASGSKYRTDDGTLGWKVSDDGAVLTRMPKGGNPVNLACTDAG